jgi:phosphoribosylcarboxyaminoimidazole (NCAIR) mutase
MIGSTMTCAGMRAIIIGAAAAAAAVGVLAVPAQTSSWSSYIGNA